MRIRSLGGAVLAAGTAVWIAAGGCSYTVSGVLPGHLKTLSVPVFGNNTVEFRLADDVTQALNDAFLANPRLRIVRERDADAVLRGTVLSYRNQVYGYTEQERATQYEIVLVVQVTFRDQVKNRVLWKEDQLAVRTTYNVVPVGTAGGSPDSLLAAPRTEADGRAEVIRKLADQIVSRTVQGW